ncbi:MAG: LL-diaminopimelate aminotransferase [Bacteroidales bacterium]|nr:LL-diaminopimelate aminotransferase [Candidatus Physcousia equi]
MKAVSVINKNFLQLSNNYLFAEIAKRVKEYKENHADEKVISLGIGDVTRPLPPAITDAMHKAVDELGVQSTFRGYGPERGYDFLREAIIEGDFKSRGVEMDASEVFVNDGAKSDTGNIGDILSADCTIGITDPAYPVYIDSNRMAGRQVEFISDACSVPDHKIDVVYLCYPNNPTGEVLTREMLTRWVEWAQQQGALLLYDAAYEAFIRDEAVPHSIYEIPGARSCAIEFHSFSKTAGFTGVRCGYTVIPKDLGELNHLWERRQCTKFNGASYIAQRGAEAVYSAEGRKQTRAIIDYYMENARLMTESLTACGYEVRGGKNAPYLWVKTPAGCDSWAFFDKLLNECSLVCTPGVGFGKQGEGYVRFTAFGEREDCIEAMKRIQALA